MPYYDLGVQSTCWSPSLHCRFTSPTCPSKIWGQGRVEGQYHMPVFKWVLKPLDTPFRHQQTNFSQLKPRIVNLLVSALQVCNTALKSHLFTPLNSKVETETGNAQMLLGCLLLVVQDSAALEVPLSCSHGDWGGATCLQQTHSLCSRECKLNLSHTLQHRPQPGLMPETVD